MGSRSVAFEGTVERERDREDSNLPAHDLFDKGQDLDSKLRRATSTDEIAERFQEAWACTDL